MASVSKFANANTVVTTGFTNPTNAYADDGVYATAIPAKNASVVTDYGFASFSADIPAGSTINSVTMEIQFKVSVNTAIVTVGLQVNKNGSLQGSRQDNTAEPASDTLLTHQVTSGITLADLTTANQMKARVSAINGNTSNTATISVDYVKITVDYTVPAAPTVTDSAATSISYTTATGNGNVTSDNGATITERGVVWGLSANPTTADSKQTAAGTTGAFTAGMSSLSPNTTYHYRAYAINSVGTSYGADQSFTTLALAAPTVTTQAATSVTATTATGNGTVTDNGGQTITERGICYIQGTSGTPTTSDSKVSDTTNATGAFTKSLTGLSSGAHYRLRAYANNASGTSYGATVQLDLVNTAPTVALNTPADAATGVSTTPTLNFTGTDADADTLEYHVQVVADTRYKALVLANSPVSYWRLGESSGNAADETGGNTGTYTNSPTLGVAGLVDDDNTAVRFARASSQFVSIGKPSNLNISGNLTVEAVINQTTVVDGFPFADFDAAGSVAQMALRILSGRFYWYQYHTDATSLSIDSGCYLDAGVTYHIAAVRDDTAKTVTLYVNGVQVGQGSYSGKTVVADTSAGNKTIARAGSYTPGDYFNGVVDEVAVYPAVLSSADLLAHANAVVFGTPATYYFDAHLNTVAGTPDDPGSEWSNDANATDGSTSTAASNAGNNVLYGKGTTAPSSGDPILEVRVRAFAGQTVASGRTLKLEVFTSGLAETLTSKIFNSSTPAAWSGYYTLATPSGGWTWAKIQALEFKFNKNTSGAPGSQDLYRVDVQVVTGSINRFSDTDTGFTAGHPFASGAAKDYNVQGGEALAAGDYYWRVRAIDPTGGNIYGAWSNQRVFTVPAGGGSTPISASDSGSGTDTVSIIRKPLISETGAGTDTFTRDKRFTLSDTGAGSDVASGGASLVNISVSDGATGFANGYGYKRAITIDYTKVAGSANLTNFPVLVSGTYTYLKTVANGGNVEHASGYDIRFELPDGTKLDHDIMKWDATTGVFSARVRVPTLSYTADTVINMFYGKAGLSATEANPTGTYSSAYKFVAHLENADDIIIPLTGSVTGASVVAAKINNGYNFRGAGNNDIISYGNNGLGLEYNLPFTISAWVKSSNVNRYSQILSKGMAGSPYSGWFFYKESAGEGHTLGLDLISTITGSNWVRARGSASIGDNTLHHVAVTYDGSGAYTGVKFYIDGVLDTTLQYAAGTVTGTIATSVNLAIGNRDTPATNNQAWDGEIDEVHVLDVVRTVDWLLTEYRNDNSPSTFYAVGSEVVGGGAVNGTDSLAVQSRLTISQSGSATDVMSLVARILRTDSGAGADVLLSRLTKNLSETGSGTETLSERTSLTISQSGAGSELVSVLSQLLLSDSGATTDIASVLARIAIINSGVGTDIISIAARIVVQQAGTGTDTFSILVRQLISQSATGTDVASIVARVLIQQGATGTDAISTLARIAVAQSGTGTDSISALISLVILESASGSEAIAIPKSLSVSESGTGSESPTVRASVQASDTGSATDDANKTSLGDVKSISDSGTGADVASLIAQIFAADTALGSEVMTILTHLALSETATGTEALDLIVRIALAESANGTDSATRFEAGDVKMVTDEGLGAEALNASVGLNLSDTATATEAITTLARLTIVDNALADDIISILSRVTLGETGSATELFNVIAKVAETDEGAGEEMVAALVRLAIQDDALGTDEATAENVGYELTITDSGSADDLVSLLTRITVIEIGLGNDTVELAKIGETAKNRVGRFQIKINKGQKIEGRAENQQQRLDPINQRTEN